MSERSERMSDLNDLLYSAVPEGWRFYTCDASIEGQWSVTLVRDGFGKKWWHSLPEETREIVALYATGKGESLSSALDIAADKTIGGI